MRRVLIGVTAAALWSVVAADVRAGVVSDFFVVGDIYATITKENGPNLVDRYSSDGAYIDMMPIRPIALGASARGLAFGPDGLLYVVQSFPGPASKFEVQSYNSSGVLQDRYAYDGPGSYLDGNISFGKIGFDDSGHFYVGSGGGLVQFTQGSTESGRLFFPTAGSGVFDVKALANGNLLVALRNDVYEIDGSGTILQDLKHVGGGGGLDFADLRGIEYDAGAGVLYATMLGYTGHSYQIMKIDFATGALLGTRSFNYADDLSLSADGRLVVGSRTQSPITLDEDLNLLNSLSSSQDTRMFVTQFGPAAAVPEPASIALLGFGVAVATLGAAARRRPR
mgnify:CR=1 FL=1